MLLICFVMGDNTSNPAAQTALPKKGGNVMGTTTKKVNTLKQPRTLTKPTQQPLKLEAVYLATAEDTLPKVKSSAVAGSATVSDKKSPTKKPTVAPKPLKYGIGKTPTPIQIPLHQSAASSKLVAGKSSTPHIRYATRTPTTESSSKVPTPASYRVRKTVNTEKASKPVPPIPIKSTTMTIRVKKEKAITSIPQVKKRGAEHKKENVKPAATGDNNNSKGCKCDDNQNCICEQHERAPGSCTLKKTKSTRTPQRHATYVSELDKNIRVKFRKQKAEREKAEKAKAEKAKNKTDKTSKSKKIEKVQPTKPLPSPGRVVHCPLHSKYGSNLSNRFIKARCIVECPHYKEQKDSRSNSPAKTDSGGSATSSPKILPKNKKRLQKVNNNNVRPSTAPFKGIPKPDKAVTPFVIGTSSNASKNAIPRTRIRSVPAYSTKQSRPVQSYLVRNGLMPDPSHKKETAPKSTYGLVQPRPKVRQKSFKLSRTKSKSFKYKNKPVVNKRLQEINSTKINYNTKHAEDSDAESYVTDLDTECASTDCPSTTEELSSNDETIQTQQQKLKSPKIKKTARKKSLKLSRTKSRSKSFRLKSKFHNNGATKKQPPPLPKKSDSLLSEDSLQFDDDSLADNLDNYDYEGYDVSDGVVAMGDAVDDDDEMEFEDDDELIDYYYELFKKEFPEIVEQADLTKEELVSYSIEAVGLHIFFSRVNNKETFLHFCFHSLRNNYDLLR